ncbi:MAG: FAD-binding protein [Proteobacteria bacterium]|nr:FAD-binding protein [Pseudomonadota bacterium]
MSDLSPYTPLTPEIIERIRENVGPEAVDVTPQALDEASRDASTEVHVPVVVVRATSCAQVQALLRLANELHFPVTPRGAGTGLAGGALAVHGGVVLALAGMKRILDIDAKNLIAVVEPGVIVADLQAAARAKGLCYPPDPASLDTATVGGTAATNAGGPACVKYGVTKHYVLGLEAVLPTGELLGAGTATRKGVVGYDLAQLLVGSEGTLGVITKLILKLIPLSGETCTQVALFADLSAAMGAVSAIMAGGVTPSAVEFLDSRCLHLVGDLLPFGDLPRDGALLLLETDGAQGAAQAEMERVGAICVEQGALHLLPATDEAQRGELWGVRRQVSQRIHDSDPIYVPEDVVLPLARIAEFVGRLPEMEERHGLTIYAFGHSGDGNIHINVTGKAGLEERMEACVLELLKLVLAMGGTMSGEHGIGVAKKRFLPLELSEASMRIQRGIKDVFDPQGILNPGKLFR